MSLATRCPACGTTFRVVRDQLRISDGWVRCGRCSQVFDASEHLQDRSVATVLPPVQRFTESEAPPPPPVDATAVTAPLSAPAPIAVPAVPSPLEGLTEGIEAMAANSAAPRLATSATSDSQTSDSTPHDDPPWTGLVADEAWPSLPSLEMGAASKRAAVWSTFRRRPSALPPQPAQAPLVRLAQPDAGPLLQPLEAEAPPPVLQPSVPEVDEALPAVVQAAAEETAPPVSFLDSPPAASRRDDPRRRRSLLTVAVMAALLLTLQVLVQFRDTFVARQPSLQPAFAALCDVLRCELSALRQIDDITIDGASFTRQRVEGGYLLNFTLRNRATVPLAMPSVEIALLDLQERTVVRRVLMPAEFGAPALLAARGERSASLPLVLKFPISETAALPAIAGYHLNAFYP